MTISFSVPLESDILIKKDQVVDFNTPLYKTGSTQVIEIDLATKLATPPKKIFQHLKKFVGEIVKKGDLIAQSSSFLSNKSYFSEHEGVIKEIDHSRGIIIIEVTTSDENVKLCYFKGEVAEIDKNTIKLKVKHAKEYDLAEASGSYGGPTIYSRDPEKGHLSEEDVGGRVVVDDTIPGYEQAKYDALGAIGFVYCDTLTLATQAPNAKLKDGKNYDSIVSAKLPYCIIDKSSNTIFFYE